MPAALLAPEYPVQTRRLLLRPINPVGDADAIYAYQSRPEVCRYLPYEPRTREEIIGSLARARCTLEEPGQAIRLAVVVRASGLLIGDTMLMWTDHTNAEIGYVFHPAHHGNGYATEACRELLRMAFLDLRAHRVTARIDQRNLASTRVVAKLGMRQEATLLENEWFKGEWSSEVDYALLDREWRLAHRG
jgi:RimJ/RimL family protein N-acetyltransferase